MRYSLFNRAIQTIAATESGARFWSQVLHHVDRIGLKVSGNRLIVSAALSGLPVVMLTTVGAKSGLPRTVPLVAILEDDENLSCFALIASNWGQLRYPAWYFNLKAHPQVICRLRGQTATFLAQEVHGEDYDRIWTRAQQIYVGFAHYRQRLGERRKLPIIMMQRQPEK